MVTIDHETLQGALKAARLDTGEALTAGEARRLACGAGLIPAVLGGGSVALDLGRESRLFSEAQRLAKGLQHDTCVADGCERPYAWCELHHRTLWSKGGRTDLDDAIPLCHQHHQWIHDTAYCHRNLPDGSLKIQQTHVRHETPCACTHPSRRRLRMPAELRRGAAAPSSRTRAAAPRRTIGP